jgi:hypothetical protein
MLAVHAARGDSQNPNIRPSLLEQWDDLRTKGVKFDEVVHRADAASGDSPIRTLPPFRLITRATERLAEIRKAEEEIKAAQKKLAELAKLENSKVVLPLAEVQKLNAKPKLVEDLAAMQAESRGWFASEWAWQH